MSYRPDRVLVTGGAGFIGSNFVHRLQRSGEPSLVVTLDRLSTGGDERNLAGLERADRHVFVRGDISDMRGVAELVREHRIDTVVHFAAESHVDRSIADPLAFVETNVSGTVRLLQTVSSYWLDERAAPARRAAAVEASVRFHHVSSDEVYGTLGADDAPFAESAPYRPRSPYAASKAGADHLVRAWYHTYGLPVTISNCSNNFGPRQHREKLIPTVIAACRAARTIPLYGDGTHRRDWIFVDDHCAGIEHVIADGRVGATYHLGGGTELANRELIAQICEIMDHLSPADRPYAERIGQAPDRPGHDWRYAMDTTRAVAELGWKPCMNFEAALQRTCAWYLEHPEYLG